MLGSAGRKLVAEIWGPGHVAPPKGLGVGGSPSRAGGPLRSAVSNLLSPAWEGGTPQVWGSEIRGLGNAGLGRWAPRHPPAASWLGDAWHAARCDPYARRVRPLVCGNRPGAGVRRALAAGRRARGRGRRWPRPRQSQECVGAQPWKGKLRHNQSGSSLDSWAPQGPQFP